MIIFENDYNTGTIKLKNLQKNALTREKTIIFVNTSATYSSPVLKKKSMLWNMIKFLFQVFKEFSDIWSGADKITKEEGPRKAGLEFP